MSKKDDGKEPISVDRDGIHLKKTRLKDGLVVLAASNTGAVRVVAFDGAEQYQLEVLGYGSIPFTPQSLLALALASLAACAELGIGDIDFYPDDVP